MPDPDPLPSIKTPWRSTTPRSDAREDGVTPVVVPDHTLLRRIGQGSYGEVWLARNVLGVYRAVKIVHRRSFDDDRPFEREFAGMQRFEPVSRSHESQLNILHVGRGPDCFYYVMELADGMGQGGVIDENGYAPRTLRSELLFRGRLAGDECIRLGLALTTALGHLHRHGLVHRDIKPSNIVFVNDIPKLADIGLVASAEATMSFVGTEGYLPPEGPGTVQADIFSLGKTLYEISTGRDRQQFPELPTGITELPDRAALAELNEVLLRACAPNAKERYETAAEMHADLALLQSGKSVARMRAVERRLKFAIRSVAVVAAVAVLAGLAFFYQQVQTREARHLASENKALAETKTKLSDDNAKLVDASRERLVRLDIANGVRLLDEGDQSAALLWFAEALPLVTNRPEEAIHRIRIQQVQQATPRLLADVACSNNVSASAWSPDGRTFALGTYLNREGSPTRTLVQLHDAADGHILWTAGLGDTETIGQLSFSRDGRRLMSSSIPPASRRGPPRREREFTLMLDAESGRELYPRFASNLVCAAYSPDDRWLALAETNHVIRVVNAINGTSVVELKGHTNDIQTISFSAHGNLLASASKDQTVRLWRLPGGEVLGLPLVHENPVKRALLSDDGSRLLTQTEPSEAHTESDCLVQVWLTQTGARIGKPIREKAGLSYLAFSPGTGERFVLGGYRFEVDVRDSISQERIYPPLKMTSFARCGDFSSDRKALAIGSDDGSAYIWDFETGEPLHPRFRHTGWMESVRFSPHGKRLLTSGDDSMAKVWSLAREAESAARTLPADFAENEYWDHILFGRKAGPIAIILSDEALHLVETERLVEVASLKPQEPGNVLAIWSAGYTGRFWAVEEAKPSDNLQAVIYLWEKKSDGFTCRRLLTPPGVLFMAFTPDDSLLRTFCQDKFVQTWRTSDGTLESTLPVPTNSVAMGPDSIQSESYWFHPDGNSLLLKIVQGSVGQGGEPPDYHLKLFDILKSEWTGTPFSFRDLGTTQTGFSPDGSQIALVLRTQHGLIFDLRAEGKKRVVFKHGGYLQDLDWSPDGKRLLTAGLSPEVKAWDTTTGEMLLSPMRIGDKPIRSGRWSADGRLIVARSDENLVRVWDGPTAEAVTPLLRHSGRIRWACVTSGNRLITATEPNLLRAWDLKPTLLPLDIVADYSKLLAGRRLNESGTLLALKPDELTTLFESLRKRAPELFSQP